MNLPAAAPNDAEEEVQQLVNTIPDTVGGLRDRAIVTLVAYAGGFLQEVLEMRIRDYREGGNRAWVQLGVGDEMRRVEISPRVQNHIEAYMTAANIRSDDPFSPLFRLTGDFRKVHPYSKTAAARLARQILNRINAPPETLSPDQIARLLKSIHGRGLNNRRDRAILGLMLYASVSPGMIARLRMHDYLLGGDLPRLRLGSGVFLDIRRTLAKLLDNYIATMKWRVEARSPLFRGRGTRSITSVEIYQMIQDRRTEEEACGFGRDAG